MLREVKAVEHDYHSEDKSITINEAEAVRLIFNLYLQGYRAYRIAKELSRLGKVNKKRDYEHSDQYFQDTMEKPRTLPKIVPVTELRLLIAVKERKMHNI